MADGRPGESGRTGAAASSVIITIDGPAGTGKSTVAHGLARRLGLDFLDTGAMYRAAALVALRRELAPENGRAVAAALSDADLRFDWTIDPPPILVGGEDVSGPIRDLEVSAVVSRVAARPEVRTVLVERQRRIAREHPRLVSEGRDQGTVVFPRADLKFYLHADVEVRAERRVDQLVASGRHVDRQQVIDDIIERDRRDLARRDGPLSRPDDAVDIDTGRGDAAQVIERLERIARERLPDAGFAR